MPSFRPLLSIVGVGVLTFGGMFSFLEATRPAPPPDPLLAAPTSTPPAVVAVTDSLAASMVAGQIAVGLPSAGSELLLQGARPGDRLDVLASLLSPLDSRPITSVVVGGATVLRGPTQSDPLLVQVSGPDAMVLAHLVLGGTRLVYTVWPDGADPPSQPALDERTARALLGLPALAPAVEPTPRIEPTPAAISPAVPPAATPRPETYVVRAGDSLYSVASGLGVEAGALWWANRSLIDPTSPLVAGSTLVVPSFSGFLYQVQTGDTWDSVAGMFGLPAADLSRRNEMAQDASLVSGMLLFIPSQS